MKISLKFKIPLIIMSFFIIFSVILFIFYRFFLIDKVKQSLEEYQKTHVEISQNISVGISNLYPDNAGIEDFINTAAQKNKLKVTVYDMQGQKVFYSNCNPQNVVSSKYKDFVVSNNKVIYLTEIEYPYAIRNLLEIYFHNNTTNLALILGFPIFFILAVYLHYSYVKPLISLQHHFKMIDFGKSKMDFSLKRKDEIGDLYRNFEEMVRRLETSYTQQLQMISSISHDLKTPLTSIMGYVERLLSANLKNEDKKQEYYKIIYKKSQDIEQLIEDFSDYSKNELECNKLQKEKVDITSFFFSICQEYQEELGSFDVNFTYENKITKEAVMEIDVKKIRRIFANLVNNSLKYVDPPINIKMTCVARNRDVVFTVEDNGKGVSEEELKSIFEAFYMTDKSRSSEKGGSGLGLAICRSIVENHDGYIKAYNVNSGGFGVEIRLPLMKD